MQRSLAGIWSLAVTWMKSTVVQTGTLTSRVGRNHVYVCTVDIQYSWQELHQIYGHIRGICTVLATSIYERGASANLKIPLKRYLQVLCFFPQSMPQPLSCFRVTIPFPICPSLAQLPSWNHKHVKQLQHSLTPAQYDISTVWRQHSMTPAQYATSTVWRQHSMQSRSHCQCNTEVHF